jgi:hypothetical protein
MFKIVDGELKPEGSRIPDYMARMVGKGRMNEDLQIFDYPMLSMTMVKLENDRAPIAGDYAECRELPEHMRHLVGNVDVVTSTKTHMVAGQERRVRSGAIWVLYPTISDQEKVTVKRGKRYEKKQVSAFVERFFSPAKVDEDEEEVLKL